MNECAHLWDGYSRQLGRCCSHCGTRAPERLQKGDPPKPTMTTREAAESLGLSVRQVQHLIKQKRLKATKPLGSDAWDVDISDYTPRSPGRPLGSVAKPKPLSVEERLANLEARVTQLENQS